MANGDPMVFQTRFNGDDATDSNRDSLLENGPLENWANTAAAADGWTWDQSQVSVLLRVAGTRTSGLGSYFQRISIASPTAALVGGYLQRVTPRGHAGHLGYGHKGQSCTVSIWARQTGAGSATINLRIAELNSADTILASSSTGATALTGTWTKYTVTRVLDQDTTRKLEINAILTSSSTGALVMELDEAEMFFAYTFAVNPRIPDDQDLEDDRNFVRTLAMSLLTSGSASSSAKYNKRLAFAIVGLTQVERFRSFYLLRTPIRWLPYHAHLPSELQVMIVSKRFDFSLMRSSFATDAYRGTLELAEI